MGENKIRVRKSAVIVRCVVDKAKWKNSQVPKHNCCTVIVFHNEKES